MDNVLITGASSGLGRALSLKFCGSEGYRVIGIGRNKEALEKVRESCKENFDFLVADLSQPYSIKSVREFVSEQVKHLEILVNNAGFGLYKGILQMTADEIIEMVNVNFVAPILLIKELLPFMTKNAVVVNIISGGVFVLMTKLPLYGATKMALHYASESLKKELQAREIHLLSVYPGVIETEFHVRAGGSSNIKGLKPEKIAQTIYNGIMKRKKSIYVPWYLRIAKMIFGPFLPPLF